MENIEVVFPSCSAIKDFKQANDTGSGEKRVYLSKYSDYRDIIGFFDNKNVFVDRKELIKYMEDAKNEYLNSDGKYHDNVGKFYESNLALVQRIQQDFLQISYSITCDGSRVYIQFDDPSENYDKYVRAVVLPVVSKYKFTAFKHNGADSIKLTPLFSDEDNTTLLQENGFPTLQKRTHTQYPLNCILYGAPGTGKTYATAQYALAIAENKIITDIASELRSEVMDRYNKLINDGQIVFTTFHQNYGYEDFIQGIRPDTSGKEMAFKTVDGVFKVIAERAMNAPNKDFVIIIDEINRANISKVFGELITLIEDDKRWGEENAICMALPSGESFAVPNNLYIVGTMNSADKSISLIDTALRRRFEFIEFVPNLKLISDPQLRTVLDKLNTGIADELNSTDLLVGHSYFMGKSIDDVCDIMNRSIIPLLYEYFFDNEKKVEAQIKKAVEGLAVEAKVSKAGRIKLVKKDVE